MVDRADIERIIAEVEKENALFGDKGCLDPLRPATAIVGREDKAKELVRFLVGGLDKGHVVPFVSVYGRSGSGKSTLVRFVCDSIGHTAKCAFVNLRMARTVFGCACAILSELSGDAIDARSGMDRVMEAISEAIESTLTDSRLLFVLALDEFDSLFSDRRGRPSDFVYRLLEMQKSCASGGG